MAAIDERSLYAAPFPHDESLDSLTAVFTAHAPVNSLRMRRHLNSKDFRGSVFVEFGSKEDAERVRQDRVILGIQSCNVLLSSNSCS
jgi:lupus La protein